MKNTINQHSRKERPFVRSHHPEINGQGKSGSQTEDMYKKDLEPHTQVESHADHKPDVSPQDPPSQDHELDTGLSPSSSGSRELAYTEKDIPDLHQAKESPMDLSSEYWSPERIGEYKVGVPVAIEESIYEDQNTGEQIFLPCVIFVEQTKEGKLRAIRNGSKRLVATIENSVKTGAITFGHTFIKIIYNGEQKNSTNQYKSDRWSVRPLIVEV